MADNLTNAIQQMKSASDSFRKAAVELINTPGPVDDAQRLLSLARETDEKVSQAEQMQKRLNAIAAQKEADEKVNQTEQPQKRPNIAQKKEAST